MAQNLKKAIIRHTFGVQVGFREVSALGSGGDAEAVAEEPAGAQAQRDV